MGYPFLALYKLFLKVSYQQFHVVTQSKDRINRLLFLFVLFFTPSTHSLHLCSQVREKKKGLWKFLKLKDHWNHHSQLIMDSYDH